MKGARLNDPVSMLSLLKTIRARMAKDQQTADDLTRRLKPYLEEPIHFIDADGEKISGYGTAPEQMFVDVELLAELIDAETLESVLKPRVVDNEAFRAAVQGGRIPQHVFTKVTRLRPQSWRVLFKPMA